MRVIVTAGPTRESIDTVRFISNASSGRMGYAVAFAAAEAGHDVTLLSGPVDSSMAHGLPESVERVPFVSVVDLQATLAERFPACDALVMAAAVGDFQPYHSLDRKLRRSAGPVQVRLIPTPDVLASVAEGKRPDQIVVAFAVEEGTPEQIETKARSELIAKHADFVVANTPEAMSAERSRACILSADGTRLDWAERTKSDLAAEIVKLLG